MGNFHVGPKVLVINDPAVAPIRFFSRVANGEYNIVEAGDDFGISGATTGPDFTTAFATNNKLTSAAHGMLNGTVVQLTTTTTLPSPLAVTTDYYVVNKTTNTFELATSEDGATIVLTDDGTGTHTVTAAFGGLDASPDTRDEEGANYNPVGADEVAANTDIADADMMEIVGFGRFEKKTSDRNATQSVTGAKSVPAQAQVSTITFALPGTFTPGESITLEFEFESSGLIGEFSSWFSDYKKSKYYNIQLIAGDTVTTIAARFASIVDQDNEALAASLFDVTLAAGVATLTCKSDQIKFSLKAVSGVDITSGVVTAVAAVTTAWYGGRNTWEQIKAMRLQTGASVYPYSQEAVSDQIPLKNAKYSSYLVSINWNRDDLDGSAVMNQNISGSNAFHIFVNESMSANYIIALAAWFNQTSGATLVQYTSTVASDVLGGDATDGTIA